MDNELQQIFNMAVDNGINLFDTADSYGTGRLNGQSEKLLGRFIRDFQGSSLIPFQLSFNLSACISKFIHCYLPCLHGFVVCLTYVNFLYHNYHVVMCKTFYTVTIKLLK